MDASQLEQLLQGLRQVRNDHRLVEAKESANDLPHELWKSLSAFANAQGGTVLLGVDDVGFRVTGLRDPRKVAASFQAACSNLEPPLRPIVDLVDHPDGVVLVAEVGPVPRNLRPCYLRSGSPFTDAFIRVGDGDHQLIAPEVAEMLAARESKDYSARPAPAGTELDPAASAALAAEVRGLDDRQANDDDATILRSRGALIDDAVSVAGAMALGRNPAAVLAAARITYRRLPLASDPPDTRHRGKHPEGTIGSLLEQVLDLLRADMRPVQAARRGAVRDVLDVPEAALREVLSNALIHRSYTDEQVQREVLVELSAEAVRVVSPGGLHTSVDISTLGLAALSGVRNLALVRLCELIKTPKGNRICELQHYGIRAADQAALEEGVAPALFIDHPAQFEVLLLRGRLDAAAAATLLTERGQAPSDENVRVVAWALRAAEFESEVDDERFEAAIITPPLAARLLASQSAADAAGHLTALESAGILFRLNRPNGPAWVLHARHAPESAEETDVAMPKREKVLRVIVAIAEFGGEANSADIGEKVGLKSSKSRSKWINMALDDKLIEATRENPFDMNRAYRLTRAGVEVARKAGVALPTL